MSARRATFKLSGDLLAESLHLPEGTVVIDIRPNHWQGYTFDVLVTHPDLPEVPEGARATEIDPVYKSIRFDWGLPDGD